MPSVISAVGWVPKGLANPNPDKIRLDESQINELIQKNQEGDDVTSEADESNITEDLNGMHVAEKETDEISKLYDLDSYGDEDSLQLAGACMQGLACYADPKEDPYLTLDTLSDTSSQLDYTINPSDNLLLVGRADEEFSVVEVHVYNDTTLDLYCHHEIMLNAYPLSIELVRLEGLSLVAVATMDPWIELWDLDLVDAVEPAIVLGKPSKKKKKKSSKASTKEHTRPVLCLSWNKNTPHLLASGSADRTVRVWDLGSRKSLETLPHPDTVQSLAWHPHTPSLLLSGCVDGKVRLFDCAREEKLSLSVDLHSEVEKVVWDHLDASRMLACTESGAVFCISAESGDVLLQIAAHSGPVTDIALSAFLPGLLVSTSVDKSYKVWEVSGGEAICLHAVNPGAGKLYCAGFSPDNPYLFAVCGEKHGVTVVDLMSVGAVKGLIQEKELKRLVA